MISILAKVDSIFYKKVDRQTDKFIYRTQKRAFHARMAEKQRARFRKTGRAIRPVRRSIRPAGGQAQQ